MHNNHHNLFNLMLNRSKCASATNTNEQLILTVSDARRRNSDLLPSLKSVIYVYPCSLLRFKSGFIHIDKKTRC